MQTINRLMSTPGVAPYRPVRPFEGGSGDYLWALLIVLGITLGFFIAEPRIGHWFLLPSMACGVLLGADVVRWYQGKMEPFDPKGIIGAVGFYGFFVAPLLHASWNIYGKELIFTSDPRYWLGVTQALNAAGIILYKLSEGWFYRRTSPVMTKWQLVRHRIPPFLLVMVPICLVAQAYFYAKRGQVAEADIRGLYTQMEGTGWMMMLGDPLPTLLLVSFILWKQGTAPRKRTWMFAGTVLLVFFVAQLGWAGLRGSRSATVVPLFWAVGLLHHYWRRLRAGHLLLGLICLVSFLYVYGLFKGMRAFKGGQEDTVKAMEAGDIEALESKTGRTVPYLLLGDLARADVQACVSQGVAERSENNFTLMYGRTYLLAISRMIPKPIWQALGVDTAFRAAWMRGKAFFEMNIGKIGANPEASSTRVFGLSGEAMLNFGFPGVPLVWFLFGMAVGWFRKKVKTLPSQDLRWIYIPFCTYLVFIMVNSDLDNLIFLTLRSGALIFLTIFLWSRRTGSAKVRAA